jgi:putative transposase
MSKSKIITKRIILPDYPHHIVQRGHNRQVIFAENEDFKNYLENLHELKAKYKIKIFAYCLMANHIHLLLQPGKRTENIGRFMKALSARATRYFNVLEGRSGTLWESKYKSSVVQSDEYLLACLRYIELNPVRAGIKEHPEEYLWSSYIPRMGGDRKEWLDIDPMFLSLGETETIRRENYLKFIGENVPSGESEFIRTALKRGQLTGNSRFIDAIEYIVGRRIERRGQGRPFKNKDNFK